MSQSGRFFTTGGGGLPIETLTGNGGGAVSPNGVGNINITGAGIVVVTGTPGTNSLSITITDPIPVANGGTGAATLTDHGIMLGSGVGAVTVLGVATDGQIPIGSTGIDPVLGTIASVGGTIAITNGAGTINLEIAGTVASSFPTDVGTATPAAGALTVAGGTNLNSAGAGSTVTVNLDAAILGTTSHDFAAGGRIGTALVAGNTLLLQAYDVDGAAYVTFATLTANNDPSMDLEDTVTKAGQYIYRAGGTDVPVTDGGTGVSTLTDHGIMLGSGVGAVTVLGVATNGQIPIGSVGADPVLGSITATSGLLTVTNGAGTIDLDVSGALKTDSGFATWSGGAPYFDDTTLGQFTVSQAGTGYIKGVLVTWASPQTVTGMTAGNTYYIYMDDTGTIGKTTVYNESLFRDHIVLFECLRDSTSGTNIQLTVKENHPFEFPWKTSVWAHDTIGSVISNKNGGANITLNGTQKIEISGADELEDHGLKTVIPDSGGAAEVFEQYFTLGSGKWAKYTQSDTFDGTWDSAGTATALGANKYSIYRLYVSKDNINSATPTYIAVLGDTQYNNLTAAQTAVANDTSPTATAELAMLELAQLGLIIFEESSTSIVSVIIAKETARTSFSGMTATVASLVLTDVTNFDGILSASDTTVQSALETIDDWGKTATDHGVLIGQGVNTPVVAQVLTDGQLIVGSTGVDPVAAALTGGNNIGITNAAGSITVNVNGTTQYALQVGDATNSLDSLAIGTATQILQSGGAGANPAWSTATYPATTAQGDLLYSSADNTIIALTKDATATRYLANTGATNNPVWDQVELTNGVSGTLPVGNGGSGAATFTDHGVLIGSGASAFTALTVGTDGQVLLGSTGADPVFATLASSGGTITFTPGAGTLNLEASSGGISWSIITVDLDPMIVDTGYICNKAGLLTVTLPTTAAVGTVHRVTGMNTDLGWKIEQNANQIIHFGDASTTTGVGGSLASVLKRDSVELVCVVADLEWNVISSLGNITIV